MLEREEREGGRERGSEKEREREESHPTKRIGNQKNCEEEF
jgi:hypothetical protein